MQEYIYYVVIHNLVRMMWKEKVTIEEFNKTGFCYKDVLTDPVNTMVVFESYNEKDCDDFIKNKEILYRHSMEFGKYNKGDHNV